MTESHEDKLRRVLNSMGAENLNIYPTHLDFEFDGEYVSLGLSFPPELVGRLDVTVLPRVETEEP